MAFGGGGGGILDMIIRLRYNRELLKNSSRFKNGYFQNKEFYEAELKKRDLNYKTATPEQLEEIRMELMLYHQRNQKLRWVVTVVVSIILVIGIWAIVNMVIADFGSPSPGNSRIEKENLEREKQLQKQEKQYDFYLEDGDKWLNKGHYHNAVYQYELAVKAHPERFYPQYRYGLALVYQCNYDQENCDLAGQQLEELIRLFPNHYQVFRLRANYYLQQGDSSRWMIDMERADKVLKSEFQ
ncbi:hypothetical protein KFE98_00320 [bacterium SCSIO 12741]|nr:hypothetical protein KFE98_00320 [bacterium SCSIO 12741]